MREHRSLRQVVGFNVDCTPPPLLFYGKGGLDEKALTDKQIYHVSVTPSISDVLCQARSVKFAPVEPLPVQ